LYICKVMNRSLPNHQYGGSRPQNFYEEKCHINQISQVLPNGKWEKVPMNPSTVKHLYSTKPNNYEQRFQYRPVGTLYDNDFSQTYKTGMGTRKVISGGHFKAYPLTNIHTVENRDYTSYNFPRPTWSTQHQREYITNENHIRPDGWK